MYNKFIVGFGRHNYLCHYLKGHSDILSNRIIDFKNGVISVEAKWIDWAKREIVALYSESGTKIDYVIRSLGHDELTALAEKPLARLARGISDVLGSTYIPQLVSKNRVTTKITGMKLPERQKELEGVFKANEGYNLNGKTLLIVDDVATSGTTIKSISEAIRQAYPTVRIKSFSLAQTNNDNPEINSTIESPFSIKKA